MSGLIAEPDFSYVSDGAEMLGKQPGTLRQLAERTGVPEPMLSRLRSGGKSCPSEAVGKKLEETLGIPFPQAWQLRDQPGAPDPSASEPEKMTPHAHLEIARSWRQRLQRIEASAKDVTSALEIERKAIALVMEFDRDEKRFTDVIDLIIETLQEFPEAREAVQQALVKAGL